MILSPEVSAVTAPALALSLRLFGPMVVSVHGVPMPKIRSQKEQWLLALLALRAKAPLERSWLATTLWPETTDEAALYNLRRTLTFLRGALGPEADRLRSPAPRTLRLDLDGVDCDVAAFDAAIRRGDEASLADAAALYAGPLLLGCSEEWALPEREARERDILSVLETLAAGARARGEWAKAAAYLGRALEIDPLREPALRALLQVLIAQGSPAAATAAYRTFRRRVRDELNAELDPGTIAIYRRIQEDGRRHASPEPSAPTPPLPGHAAHLPTPLTTLIGRADEMATAAAALKQTRLVTLTGPGGVGKTRLAVALAHSLHKEFNNGAWFADFAPLSDPKLLPAALTVTFGLMEGSGRAPTEMLVAFLKHRQLLLVLDNCEHLAEPCAHLALGLLQACPALCILATSRESLRVPGEAIRPVLGLPPLQAARLFSERATQSNPAFRVTPAAEEVVADICRRLDGLPLAIEMAAARTRVLPLTQIASRLDDAFRLLSEPGGDLLPRHQTLRATLDWSYHLLTSAEKTMLARLSVFAGGWTLEAAEAVCASSAEDLRADRIGSESVLDLLASLVDKSLVVYEEPFEGMGRYRLLETLRQYATAMLPGTEQIRLSECHADYCLSMAEKAQIIWAGPDQNVWFDRFQMELNNIRAALDWDLNRPYHGPGVPLERALRTAKALLRFWWMRGHLSEGREYLTTILARTVPIPLTEVWASGLSGCAVLAGMQGDYAPARVFHEQALGIRRQLGDRRRVAVSLHNLAEVSLRQGNYEEAHCGFHEAVAINTEFGRATSVANHRTGLGEVAYALNDYDQAEAQFAQSLAYWREINDPHGIGMCLLSLGRVASGQGALDLAHRRCVEALKYKRQVGDRIGIAETLEFLGTLAARRRHSADLAYLCGAAQRLREEIACPLPLADRAEYGLRIAEGQRALGDGAFAAAWAEGRAMTWEQAVDCALGEADSASGL